MAAGPLGLLRGKMCTEVVNIFVFSVCEQCKVCYTSGEMMAFVLGLEKHMLDYERRIAALEKDAATMKRDIIYKLDDTNSEVTMIKGIVGNQGQDIKEIKNQARIANVRLDGIDTRLEGLKEEIRAIKDQQDGQGQALKEIKRRLDTLEETITQRFSSLEGKFEQLLQVLTPPKAEL